MMNIQALRAKREECVTEDPTLIFNSIESERKVTEKEVNDN